MYAGWKKVVALTSPVPSLGPVWKPFTQNVGDGAGGGGGGRGENKYDDVLMRVPVDKQLWGKLCGQTGENTPSPRGPVPTS